MRRAASIAVLLFALACRNANGGSASSGIAIVPGTFGVNGCFGPDQVFVSGGMPTTIALATLDVGASSELAAASDAELLFATGQDGTVVAIDVSGASPVETVLVSPGVVDALLAGEGIADPAELGGVAVLDADTLLAIEQTSHALITIDRATPDIVGFYAGLPSTAPGFADGLATGTAGLARFGFGEASQLRVTGDVVPRVFVADPGNHAVRMIDGNAVRTIAGHGNALFADGDLAGAFFDTPTGLAITCDGRLLVSERGANGFGNRLRSLSIGGPSPFGGFFGAASTIAGDGTGATTGGASLLGAQLDAPESPIVTANGETYWIDAASGVLRRRLADGTCDCPLHADCATAVGAPEFTPGHRFSLASTPAGKLFVLDATAGTLHRVGP